MGNADADDPGGEDDIVFEFCESASPAAPAPDGVVTVDAEPTKETARCSWAHLGAHCHVVGARGKNNVVDC